MRGLVLGVVALVALLALAGCGHLFASGTVTEHGARNIRVGIPL